MIQNEAFRQRNHRQLSIFQLATSRDTPWIRELVQGVPTSSATWEYRTNNQLASAPVVAINAE
jgi:hypothetical protein